MAAICRGGAVGVSRSHPEQVDPRPPFFTSCVTALAASQLAAVRVTNDAVRPPDPKFP
jgi:hypothetical protein